MNMEWTEEALGNEVAAHRFALIDIGLFLDTHPEDAAALRKYTEYNNQYQELYDLYTRLFGPLRMSDVSGRNGWTWGATPMPEEGGR